jgi:hypothetical protein
MGHKKEGEEIEDYFLPFLPFFGGLIEWQPMGGRVGY